MNLVMWRFTRQAAAREGGARTYVRVHNNKRACLIGLGDAHRAYVPCAPGAHYIPYFIPDVRVCPYVSVYIYETGTSRGTSVISAKNGRDHGIFMITLGSQRFKK